MFKYLIFIILGVLIGYYFDKTLLQKIKRVVLPFSILFLLFFMGVGIGKDPDLIHKISDFGINAAVISIFSILFSVLFVFLFVRVLKKLIDSRKSL